MNLIAAFVAGILVGACVVVLIYRRNSAKQHRDRLTITRHQALIRAMGK